MKICIDAGHNYSAFDTGAQANHLKEQEITFQVAQKLRQKLEEAGIQVVMTRETMTQNLGTSVSTSIGKRVERSNRENCDYFVSLHANAGGGTGCEVLVYKKGATAEKLAESILDFVVERLPLRSREVKEANLGVLRDTLCPAVLVELAFIDHPADSLLLKNRQEEFARAIGDGILSFLGIESPLSLDEMKQFLKERWGLSEPDAVFSLLDTHPYREDLYRKLYDSYRKE